MEVANYTATIIIYDTHNVFKLTCTYDNDIKRIIICLNQNDSINVGLIQDYTDAIRNHTITSVVVSRTISERKIRLFTSIARYYDRPISMNELDIIHTFLGVPRIPTIDNFMQNYLRSININSPRQNRTNRPNEQDSDEKTPVLQARTIQQTLSPNYTIQPVDTPQTRAWQNIPDISQFMSTSRRGHLEPEPVEPNQFLETEPPERFKVDEKGDRTISIFADNAQQLDEKVPDPLNNIVISPLQHPSSIPNRADLSEETIVTYVKRISDIIAKGKATAPDFHNKTYAGYKKIKNFIHNNTKIWMNQREIDIFVSKLNLQN
jgi:hypothetical protein